MSKILDLSLGEVILVNFQLNAGVREGGQDLNDLFNFFVHIVRKYDHVVEIYQEGLRLIFG